MEEGRNALKILTGKSGKRLLGRLRPRGRTILKDIKVTRVNARNWIHSTQVNEPLDSISHTF